MRKTADRLIGLFASIGALGLFFEVGVILVDVIGRSFGRPVYGSQDLIGMTMVIVVFGAMALCDRNGGHISVDLFERYFPSRLNRWIDVLAAVTGAVIFVGIAWTVWESSKISTMLNLSTNLLNLPKAWFQWVLSIFAIGTALGMALRAIEMAFRQTDIRKHTEPDL